jgi:hemoglobin
MGVTLFDRCGGFSTVRKLVSAFYDKVLDSPRLQRHFAAADMRTLIDHQTKFISSVMGGPASFDDEALRRAHAALGITKAEFLEVATLMRETLEDFGFPPADVETVHRAIVRRESIIVSRRD